MSENEFFDTFKEVQVMKHAKEKVGTKDFDEALRRTQVLVEWDTEWREENE